MILDFLPLLLSNPTIASYALIAEYWTANGAEGIYYCNNMEKNSEGEWRDKEE